MQSIASLLNRLERPQGVADVVLDTDAYNEIDDQFAIAYLLKAGDRARVRALYAAPFYAPFNPHSASAKEGMTLSYQEILKLCDLAGFPQMKACVLHGSERFLSDEQTPVDSPAARDLAQRAMQYTPEQPLYVISIGAITNIASAMLIAPAIKDRIVVIWLGGHAEHWPDTVEFNLMQDVAAARVVMGSGAAMVQLPCMGVVDTVKTTEPELRHWLKGQNALCDYLYENTVREAETYAKGKPWSRVIWDITAVAWLLDRTGGMIRDRIVPAPIPEYDLHYGHDSRRMPILQAYSVDRDAVFEDLFGLLRKP